MRFPVEIRKNQDFRTGDQAPRYHLEMDLDRVVPGRRAVLPVYWRPNRSHPLLKEIYQTEIGGFQVERGNLPSLVDAVQAAVSDMVEGETLPYYSLVLPNGNRIPIFLNGEKLYTRMGKRSIEGTDIGEVYGKLRRELLSDGSVRRQEDLKLDIFLWHDLRLYPPAMIIKDPGGQVWVPIFCHLENEEIRLNYDLLNRPSRIFTIERLSELRAEVARTMASYGAMVTEETLYMDEVRDEVWREVRGLMSPRPEIISYEVGEEREEIEIFEREGELIAGARPMVFFGRDIDGLGRTVADILQRTGRVSSSMTVRIERRR
ncbi:MAG: hypothetical protein ACLFPN_05135 [Methanomassiliicoccales archaeon]